MNTYRNPLIQNDTIDTLTHIEKVITFLQDYHLVNSLPEAPAQQVDTHSGLFWVLSYVNQAIEFEVERLNKH
jgi:hypothetical protein